MRNVRDSFCFGCGTGKAMVRGQGVTEYFVLFFFLVLSAHLCLEKV